MTGTGACYLSFRIQRTGYLRGAVQRLELRQDSVQRLLKHLRGWQVQKTMFDFVHNAARCWLMGMRLANLGRK